MFGRWLGSRAKSGTAQSNALTGIPVPQNAGMLSCRVLDPVSEPVQQAEFVVTDSAGRKVVGGETDPFGNVVATVPAGDYRLARDGRGLHPLPRFGHGDRRAPREPRRRGPPGGAAPQLPDPGDWEIEPSHTQIGFTARHIGMARIHGRFNTFAGAVRIADRMEDSAMHVIIDASSIDTNVQMRDDHLRSGDFLDVERYPTLEFYSERFVHRGGTPLGRHRCADPARGEPHRDAGHPVPRAWATAWRARPVPPAGRPPNCTARTSRSPGRRCWRAASRWSGPSIKIEMDIQIVPKG